MCSVGSFLSICDIWVPEHRLSSYGILAYLLCGTWDLSSPTRDQTHVPCIGRQILNHWTTSEVPLGKAFFFFFFFWGKGSILKDKVRERSCRVCDQLVHSSLTG